MGVKGICARMGWGSALDARIDSHTGTQESASQVLTSVALDRAMFSVSESLMPQSLKHEESR